MTLDSEFFVLLRYLRSLPALVWSLFKRSRGCRRCAVYLNRYIHSHDAASSLAFCLVSLTRFDISNGFRWFLWAFLFFQLNETVIKVRCVCQFVLSFDIAYGVYQTAGWSKSDLRLKIYLKTLIIKNDNKIQLAKVTTTSKIAILPKRGSVSIVVINESWK